ncbi:MAG: hypothetical protein M3511_11505 [Deinococcota bacterium]|nr:hypothetical protein [Deinococcota bacterium]
MSNDVLLAEKFAVVFPHLNEKQRRLLLAAEARSLGHGGISRVARASGVSRATIHKALQEQEAAVTVTERVRRAGGGRKKTRERDPRLLADLEAMVDPETRGDPIPATPGTLSPLRWTCKSTRQLAQALQQQGHQVSEHLVRDLLYEAGYSLQANAKMREGSRHPDRDAQFHYLNEQLKVFLAESLPVVSALEY